uniref:Maestro heat-like repeat family member 1 n=1 Tax=Mastacembelus armatus TaxID=205130 RepID=A0A7N8YLQ4_9TELE
VQEQVRKSMLTLGKQQPDRVLAMCQDYLLKHPKLVVSHRVVILRTIELIVGCRVEAIGSPRIKNIISLASDEMTRSKEVIPDWQQAASNILVAVGNRHINDIMEEILGKFQPGVLPHIYVVQTLASLSDSNVYGMVPFLNAILGTMLPMLSMAKQDSMKWVFASALCHFSDSILDYLANLDKAPDPTVRKDTFSSEIYAAYEILFNNWLQSRESKLRLTVAEAVGSMCHLMASDKLEDQIPKLIPTILSLYKKNTEHYVISKSLCQVLDASVNMGSRVLETQLDSLLLVLHQQCSSLSHARFFFFFLSLFCVCACFCIFVTIYAFNINFLFPPATPLPLANSFPDRLVVFVLQKLENSNERSRMGSLAVLRHLINSATSTMENKKLLILASIRQPMADHSNKVKKRVIQVISAMAHHGYLELEGGELLVQFIVQHCALPDTYQVLWPKLLYYLTLPQYSNATTPLCKNLMVLGSKKKANQDPSFNIDFTQEGMGAFLLSRYYVEIISLVVIFYSIVILEILTCQEYIFNFSPLQSFLYRCIGVTLQQCFNKDLVKKQLQEILLTARHNDPVEREGVAMGVGLCAHSHLEGTLAKLDEFGKSDAFKKSPSIFNLLKERNDVEVEKVKSTLILCYGQVALNAPPEKILNRIDQDILGCISKHFNTKDLTMKLSLIQSVGLVARAISECVKKQGYIFSRKQELITVMLDFIKAEPADSLRTPVRHLVMSTCCNSVHDFFFFLIDALLGRLSPRCSDPNLTIRTTAIDSIYSLLYIQLRYEGFSLDYKDEGVDGLLLLKDRLENPDHSVLYKTCSDLTKVMSKRLPQQQLTTLVFMLFEGLVDSQTNCCRASSVILNTLLKNRGAGLQEMVKVAVGQTVLILASQHLQTVINTLVNQPLPYDSWTSEMWMALGADPIVANQIIEMVMEKLAIMAPYVDKKESIIRGGTIKCLCPSLNNIYESQRITVTAFFSELLNHHVVTELMLIDVLMNNMMERISDLCCTVRMLAVRGLGNIAVGSPEKVHHPHAHTHSTHTGAAGSITAFSVLLPSCTSIFCVLVQENDEIRCASIYLMGNLSKFGSGEPVFKDQIHNVLVSLLLHLVDPNPQVVKACKYAMRVCAPVVGSEQITGMFQNHLHDDKSLHYGEFINDLTKYLVRHKHKTYHCIGEEDVHLFFKSNWPEVRAGAAMFIGMTATPQYCKPHVFKHYCTITV